MGATERAGRRGAYGIALTGVEAASGALSPADDRWPAFAVEHVRGDGRIREEHVDGERALLRLRTGGSIRIERRPGRIVYTVPRELTAAELVHPYLAPAAAVVAWWHGREAVHGGAFAVDGRAVGLLADREGGKSSTLAALGRAGVDVVCDDMLVLDGVRPFVGPRTVDLREDAAAMLGAGEAIGVVGARPRWRIDLPALEPPDRLSSWVFLAWSDTTELVRLTAGDTLQRLLAHRGIRLDSQDPGALLDLAALPAWELRRPRGPDALRDACARLVGLASS